MKRANNGNAYIPTPVLTGATWRLLGDVLFTAIDRGGGLVQMLVSNSLPYAVDTILTWSWGGVNGESTSSVDPNSADNLQVQLPPGFDATLEIIAQKI
jgi:hypothetical protein